MTTASPIRTITIQDQNLQGNVLNELFLKFASNRITAAEIITQRVRQEVENYNNRAINAINAQSLVIPSEHEANWNGDKTQKFKPINVEKQIAIALKAFEQNGFFLLADNRQLETLDETVYLHDDLMVNFIKLTPLVGG